MTPGEAIEVLRGLQKHLRRSAGAKRGNANGSWREHEILSHAREAEERADAIDVAIEEMFRLQGLSR